MAEQIRHDIIIQYETLRQAREELLRVGKALEYVKQNTQQAQDLWKEKSAIQGWITSVRQGAQTIPTLTAGAANAGVALQNLNFVIRDSPYFFRDFSLGILAVGNNLNPLIDSMLRMKKEAQSVGQTLSGALWASLKGPAGVVLAFSALVTVLQAVTFAMSGTKSKTKDAKDEIEDLRDAVDDLGNSFSEAIKKQSEYEKSTEAASLMARINQMEGMKKKGGEYKTMVVKGEAQVFWSAWSQSQQEDLNDLYKALKEIQVPFSNFINKTEQIAKAAEQGVGGLRKLDMSYKDITDSIRGFNKIRDSYDAESKEFAYYDRIVKTLKSYQDSIDKTHKKVDKLKKLQDNLLVWEGTYFDWEEYEKEQKANEKYFNTLNNMGTGRGMKFGAGDQLSGLLGRGVDTNSFKKMMADAKDNLTEATKMAHLLGRELVNAFRNGRFELDKFIESLLSAIAEMAIINLLTSLFTGGASIPLQSISMGKSGGVIFPPVDSSRFNKSSSNEGVTFVFENVIDGQKIIYKGIKEKQAILR